MKIIWYDYYFFVLLTEWLKALADMWIFISGTKIGVKISQYYDFSWEQNRSLSFQFPKLYAIQMPAEVVNFQKQKEKVWLVHEEQKNKKNPIQTTTLSSAKLTPERPLPPPPGSAIYLQYIFAPYSYIIFFGDSLRNISTAVNQLT